MDCLDIICSMFLCSSFCENNIFKSSMTNAIGILSSVFHVPHWDLIKNSLVSFNFNLF